MDVLRLHVGFEAIYYVKAGSLAEARELIRTESLADNVQQRNVSLLHICSEEEIELLKEEGIKIIGDSDDSGKSIDQT